jgi:hypothetical protein
MRSIAERIAHSLPGSSFELEQLARIVGIEETDTIASAAVTTRGRARLLINPAFVAKHCERDEHLFLLIMHELWHVLLGHTTLYRRTSELHNVAFDALINAGLTRQHPEHAYRGFFEGANPSDAFPSLLLRAPEGWPDTPDYEPGVGPAWVPRILRQLYPAWGDDVCEPTYEELVALLSEYVDEQVRTLEELLDGVTLLGEHCDVDGTGAGARSGSDGCGEGGEDGGSRFGGDPMSDPLFGEIVRRIVEKWPPPPFVLSGRDAGGAMRASWVGGGSATGDARSVFRRALTSALEPDRSGARQQRRQLQRVTVGPGPLPNHADRTLHAKRRLVGPDVLANQQISLSVRGQDVAQRALVYLDVSGSMSSMLPDLVDLLVPAARKRLITVRQFSTLVAPLGIAELASGHLTTTQGTHIDCVLEDAAQRKERRMVIVTDGYVGAPAPHLLAALRTRGVKVISVLPQGGWRSDLDGWSDIVELPGVVDR